MFLAPKRRQPRIYASKTKAGMGRIVSRNARYSKPFALSGGEHPRHLNTLARGFAHAMKHNDAPWDERPFFKNPIYDCTKGYGAKCVMRVLGNRFQAVKPYAKAKHFPAGTLVMSSSGDIFVATEHKKPGGYKYKVVSRGSNGFQPIRKGEARQTIVKPSITVWRLAHPGLRSIREAIKMLKEEYTAQHDKDVAQEKQNVGFRVSSAFPELPRVERKAYRKLHKLMLTHKRNRKNYYMRKIGKLAAEFAIVNDLIKNGMVIGARGGQPYSTTKYDNLMEKRVQMAHIHSDMEKDRQDARYVKRHAKKRHGKKRRPKKKRAVAVSAPSRVSVVRAPDSRELLLVKEQMKQLKRKRAAAQKRAGPGAVAALPAAAAFAPLPTALHKPVAIRPRAATPRAAVPPPPRQFSIGEMSGLTGNA